MNPQVNVHLIKTRVAILSMEEDDIIRMTLDHKNGLDIDDIKDILSGILKITGGKKALILGKSIHYNTPSREVRAFAADFVNTDIIQAAATVASNIMIKVAANFFLKINKPPFPFKVFTEEKEAILWLKSLKTKI